MPLLRHFFCARARVAMVWMFWGRPAGMVNPGLFLGSVGYSCEGQQTDQTDLPRDPAYPGFGCAPEMVLGVVQAGVEAV